MVDWTINLGNLISMGSGIIAFVVIGVKFRDTLRDVAAMVQAHKVTIDDHEERIRSVERRHHPR